MLPPAQQNTMQLLEGSRAGAAAKISNFHGPAR
jgi:hypothetical protein